MPRLPTRAAAERFRAMRDLLPERREDEEQIHGDGQASAEFREEDFPDLKH